MRALAAQGFQQGLNPDRAVLHCTAAVASGVGLGWRRGSNLCSAAVRGCDLVAQKCDEKREQS